MDFWLITKLDCDLRLVTKARNSGVITAERVAGWWRECTGGKFRANNPAAYCQKQLRRALGINDPPKRGQCNGIADTIELLRKQRGIQAWRA